MVTVIPWLILLKFKQKLSQVQIDINLTLYVAPPRKTTTWYEPSMIGWGPDPGTKSVRFSWCSSKQNLTSWDIFDIWKCLLSHLTFLSFYHFSLEICSHQAQISLGCLAEHEVDLGFYKDCVPLGATLQQQFFLSVCRSLSVCPSLPAADRKPREAAVSCLGSGVSDAGSDHQSLLISSAVIPGCRFWTELSPSCTPSICTNDRN